MMRFTSIPVVPHRAAAEKSKENYTRGELLQCMDGRANPLMDRTWMELCFLERLQWSPDAPLLDVVSSVAVI